MMENQNIASDEIYSERNLGRGFRELELQSPEARNGASGIPARRATTMTHQDPTTTESPTPESSTSLQTSQGVAAGRKTTRKRKKINWSKEMNCNVVKAFLFVNECRDDPLPGWRQKLHMEFKQRHSELELTEQNLADRLRLIYRKQMVALAEIDEIRRSVGREIHNSEEGESSVVLAVHESDTPHETCQTNDTPHESCQTEAEENRAAAACKLKENYQLFEDINPLCRLYLPKLNIKKETFKIIEVVNDALEKLWLVLTTLKQPAWKNRLLSQIDKLRAKADVIHEYINGNTSRKVRHKIEDILKTIKLEKSDPEFNRKLTCFRDELRQKFKVKGARLKRYNKTTKRKEQNREFQKNQKKFYQTLENHNKEEVTVENANKEEFLKYWSSMWSKPAEYNKKAAWVQWEQDKAKNIIEMTSVPITEEDIKYAIKKLKNWKAAGPDNIHNFWMKHFKCLPLVIVRCFEQALQNPQEFPKYLATLLHTYLLYKGGNQNDPQNFRPITSQNIVAPEQKGCIRRSLGCKEQLTVDTVVTRQAVVKKRNLSTGTSF
ncbi:uncharacterized protein LOC115889243 [Sitophilus oryzae]|uniref:Uncharacterized protein LOC115889243 n=1 Tax=Sitophilus oryzae TaxID=7048 RepID=A0A6J2YP48_SITOR|nr:uncharacterized protein LOC115889243 [Sitophilus oryzae]